MAAQTETAKAEIILNGSKANATLKEIENAAKQLNAELRKLPVTSQEFADKSKQLQAVNTRLADIRKETKALGDDMKNAGGGMQNMIGSIKTYVMDLGVAMAAAFSVAAITNYFKEGIKSAMEMRSVEKNLLDVLDGNKATQRELIGLAKERSGQTKDSRLEIEAAEKFLVIQGRTPEQIRKTIIAAQDLSVVTGDKLLKSVEDLDGTMEGRLSKGLQKLSKEFKDLSKEQMYNGDAIDIIAKKYKGLAVEEMKTEEGQLILLEKSWKALKRTLGDFLLGTNGVFSNLITGATDALKTMSKFLELPLAQKYKNEQESLNALVFQIQATNTNQKERNRLITELRAKYPEFLGNLRDEDVTNQFLAKHLEEVNMQYMEKIRLAQSEAALSKIAEKQVDASKKLSELETDRNKILAKSMSLLYDSKPAYARLVEQASSLEEKIRLVKKYWGEGGGTTGTAGEFLAAAEKAKQAADKMKVYQVQFTQEQLKIAEEAVSSSLAMTNTLDAVSNQILTIALNSKDEITRQIIKTELADRERTRQTVEAGKVVFKEDLDWKKMSVDQLNDYISKGREADATNADRNNMRKATAELATRDKLNDKLKESYQKLMDSLAEIEGKNYAEKLSETQNEIKGVREKFEKLIDLARKYKEDNAKTLSTDQKGEIDTKIGDLEIARDLQVKQVLEQAEQKFSDDVMKIAENLRVARMTVTQRQVYEVNKYYRDAQKEIKDAIGYAYTEEVIAAKGNADKIEMAMKNKLSRMRAVQADIDQLESYRKAAVVKAKEIGNIKFEEDLNALKLKAERQLAEDKEKVWYEVNAKYKKILDENLKDEEKTNEIKAQMTQEVIDKQHKITQENTAKVAQESIAIAQSAVNALGSIFQMEDQAQADKLKNDEAVANTKKAKLDSQLKAGLITKKQHDDKVAALDAEVAKKRKKLEHDQAVHAKEMALFNALISVASAVASALTAGPGSGIVLSIITAALGAIQIGYILSQKVPEAATGRYNVIGQQDGKAYNNVPYQESFTGIPGRPMLVNETGNEIVIDPKTTRNLMVNYPGVISAINFARVPQRASGSYITENTSPSQAGAASVASSESLTAALNEFNTHARNGIRTFMVYDDVRETAATINDIENSVKSS